MYKIMAELGLFSLAFAVLFLVARVECKDSKPTPPPCSVNGAVRLDTVRENSTCGYLQGRVQKCEDGLWKNLCDGDWTLSDAQVACRALNYSAKGAVNISVEQLSSDVTSMGVMCTGSENTFLECENTENELFIRPEDGAALCSHVISVQCFVSDQKFESNCSQPETTTTTPTTDSVQAEMSTETQSGPSTVATIPGHTQHTPGQTVSTAEAVQPPTNSQSGGTFLEPPLLYYLIAGLCLALLCAVLLAIVLICCCIRTKRKTVSDVEHQKENLDEYNKDPSLETKATVVTDRSNAHHLIQQSSAQQGSGPIYEDIPNENSSAQSQDSPQSRPAVTAAAAPELYSTLNQGDIYAQIEPHMGPTSPTAEVSSPPPLPPPDAGDNFYQKLDHTSSLKRKASLDGSKQFQAVNHTALAIEGGLVQEEDLRSPAGSFSQSNSSPTASRENGSLMKPPQLPENGSLRRPHLEQVNLQHVNGTTVSRDQDTPQKKEIVYQTLDPPLPEYNTLEECHSEISNTAVCNNSKVTRGDYRNGHAIFSSKSASTLPSSSTRSTPHSSRTNSLSASNSPQTSRSRTQSDLSNRSPLVNRLNGGGKVMNKYSQSPVSGSPLVPSRNHHPHPHHHHHHHRHSGQSDGSGSRGSEENLQNTLV